MLILQRLETSTVERWITFCTTENNLDELKKLSKAKNCRIIDTETGEILSDE